VLAGSRVWLRGQRSVIIGAAQMRNGEWQALRNSADVILDTAQPWTQARWPARWIRRRPPSNTRAADPYPRTVAELAASERGADYPVCGELIEAQYGMQHFQEGVRQGPVFLGWPHATCGAAWMLQIGILGALFERERAGSGQTVTTSLLDGAAILQNVRWLGGTGWDPRCWRRSSGVSAGRRRRTSLLHRSRCSPDCSELPTDSLGG
jgi:hypothetical protein